MKVCNDCGEKHNRRDMDRCYNCYPFLEYGSRGHDLITALKVSREINRGIRERELIARSR